MATYRFINTAHNLTASFSAVASARPDGSVQAGTISQTALFFVNTSHILGRQLVAGTRLTFRPDGSVASRG